VSDLIDFIQRRLDLEIRDQSDVLAAGAAPDFGTYRAGAGRVAGLKAAKEIVTQAWKEWGREDDED